MCIFIFRYYLIIGYTVLFSWYNLKDMNLQLLHLLHSYDIEIVKRIDYYSRVHISSDTAFVKILKKPSIVQE